MGHALWVVHNSIADSEDITRSNADATLNKQGSIAHKNDYFNYMSELVTSSPRIEYLYGSEIHEPFSEAELFINGNSRFNKRKATYFRTIQPLNHHSRVPTKHIYCYSFALTPEKHQPSGICNFSELIFLGS